MNKLKLNDEVKSKEAQPKSALSWFSFRKKEIFDSTNFLTPK